MVRGTESGRPPLGLVRIEASSYKDALKQITDRFGNDVSIVSTRQIRKKGISGALGATGVEVYVTNPDNHSAYLKSKARKLDELRDDPRLVDPRQADSRQADPRQADPRQADPRQADPRRADSRTTEHGEISALIDGLRAQIEDLMTSEGNSTTNSTAGIAMPGNGQAAEVGHEAPVGVQDAPVVRAARRMLESRGFSPQSVGDLVDLLRRRKLANVDGDREELETIARLHLGELVRAKIPHCAPIKCQDESGTGKDGPTVVALIGPTGVGKTTTIAKLASHFRLSQGKRVGLLTLDTYRIGAIDQLRRFAEIMDLELGVVEQGSRPADALAAYRDYDLVFIDTAGRSQRDARKLVEVREMLKGIGSLEVHLCTALGTARETLLDIAKKFQDIIPYDRLLITKIDESAAHGVLLDLFRVIRKPLSYVTCGQEVPHDIDSASTERLEQLLLGD